MDEDQKNVEEQPVVEGGEVAEPVKPMGETDAQASMEETTAEGMMPKAEDDKKEEGEAPTV